MIEKHVNSLKKRVLDYAVLIDSMIELIAEGMTQGNWDTVYERCSDIEKQVNAMKLEVAQESMGLIALFHPEACHLRSIIKMATIGIDLERMGDVIIKVAGISLNNSEFLNFSEYPQILQMIQEMRIMLNNVMHAFAEEDVLSAVSVIAHDDRVDDLCDSLLRKILRKIKGHHEDIAYLIQLLTIVRYIERLADHTTHIAKDVIFIKEGLTVQKVSDLQKIISERYTKDA